MSQQQPQPHRSPGARRARGTPTPTNNLAVRCGHTGREDLLGAPRQGADGPHAGVSRESAVEVRTSESQEPKTKKHKPRYKSSSDSDHHRMSAAVAASRPDKKAQKEVQKRQQKEYQRALGAAKKDEPEAGTGPCW